MSAASEQRAASLDQQFTVKEQAERGQCVASESVARSAP
jgi:hypothetical protein